MRLTCLAAWIGLLSLSGCDWIDNIHRGNQVIPTGSAPDSAVGRWTNQHPNDPNLVGLHVRQFPDGGGDIARYRGRHPAAIIYVFKDGRAHRLDYEPDGTVARDYWFRLAAGDPLWNNLEPPPAGKPVAPAGPGRL